MLLWALFFVLVFSLSLICGVHQILAALFSSDSDLFSGVCLQRLRVHMFRGPQNLCFILLQYLYSVMWFKQFIQNQQHLLFLFNWNVRDCTRWKQASGYDQARDWLKTGPLLHTPCLPSSSPCMARLDDSLPPGYSHEIPPSSAEQRPRRRSGKKL